jgi:hypothetical protein
MIGFEGLERINGVRSDLKAAHYSYADREDLEALEKTLGALEWLEDLRKTNELGGLSLDPPPFDFRGVWRLVCNTSHREILCDPVIWDREQIPEVEPIRDVVSLAKLVTSQCVECNETVPVLGRSRVRESSYGFEAEVAVVHCDTIELIENSVIRECKTISYKDTRLKPEDLIPFSPQLGGYSQNLLERYAPSPCPMKSAE